MDPIVFPLAVEAAKGIYGAFQSSKANSELDKINATPRPKYKTGAEISSEAESMAHGLTPQEMAAAQHHLDRLNNTRYDLATKRNPTLSGAAQAGVNYGSIQGQLGLAAQDAAIRRQNVQQMIGLLGSQYNRQTAADLAHRQQLEQQYGAAGQAGIKNIFSALEGAGSMVYNNALNNQWMNVAKGQGGNMPFIPTALPRKGVTQELAPSDLYKSGYYNDFAQYGQNTGNNSYVKVE
jgi:hypothetical protein